MLSPGFVLTTEIKQEEARKNSEQLSQPQELVMVKADLKKILFRKGR